MALTKLLNDRWGNEAAEQMTSDIYLKKINKQQLNLGIIAFL